MWQQQLLEQIQAIDIEQASHGLYGLSEVKADPGQPFTPVSRVLSRDDPALNPALRLHWRLLGKGGWKENAYREWLLPSGEKVLVSYTDFASTKIRHYGNGYQLDRVHGKKEAGDLDALVARLARLARLRVHGKLTAQVLIAHVPQQRRFEPLLGKTIAPAFLERCHLEHHSLIWEDRYGRGFFTGVFLWNADGTGE